MAKPDVKPIPTGDVSPSIARAVVAMRGKKMEDHGDGSKRLFAYACSAVEHDLTDADAITAIRRAAETKPFPSDWTDGDILVRVRDAERDTKRGLANSSLMTPDGRTDAANGRRFAGRFAESAYFCSLQSKWLVWDQNRWSDDARLLIESYAKKCAHEMWAEIGEHE